MKKFIADVLKKKGAKVVSIQPDLNVFQALELMSSENVGAVLVMEDEKVVGILSERDYARKVILYGRSSLDTPVREIMETNVLFVSPDMSIEEGLAVITEKRCRHLPVMEDGALVGIVSIGDLVYAVLNYKDFMINQLENYILND